MIIVTNEMTMIIMTIYDFSTKKNLWTTSKIQKHHVGYVAISFDIVSLFTNVPLQDTIEVILRKVYDEQLNETKITRKNL